ncbi:MAG: sulfotransferase [Magnetococcales bacterium]|nr:sulfotransferase [Magnetococcales bacterium]MBF0322041.1 sulfotransferase [Magnetococcales bacterium]
MKKIKLPEKVLAIIYYGRSGSELVQTLLEGHPKIITIAGNVGSLAQFYDSYVDVSGKVDMGKINHFVMMFLDCFCSMFDTRHASLYSNGVDFVKMGRDGREHLGVDPVVFINNFTRIMRENVEFMDKGVYLKALHIAYHISLGRNARDDMIIVYQLHYLDADNAPALITSFPDLLFLFMIRDPLQSFGSIMRTWIFPKILKYNAKNQTDDSVILNIISQFHQIMLGGVYPLADYRDRTRAVRFEDIKTRPRETMQKICHWLGIAWDDCLLETTFEGKRQWSINPHLGDVITGFDQTPLHRVYHEYFSWFDRLRLNAFLYERQVHWGYRHNMLFTSRFFRFFMLCLIVVPFRFEWKIFCKVDRLHFKIWGSLRSILWQSWQQSKYRGRADVIDLLEEGVSVGFNNVCKRAINYYIAVADGVISKNDCDDEVFDCLCKLVDRFPGEPNFLYFKALFMTLSDRYDGMDEVLQKGECRFPDFGPLLWVSSYNEIRKDSSRAGFEKASVLLKKSCRAFFPEHLMPTKEQSYCDLGKSLLSLGRWQEALQEVEEGLRFFPHSQQLWTVYGQSLAQLDGHIDQGRWAAHQQIVDILFQENRL